ncbi:MAG: hypothetical protein O2954_19845, partial [bacterium]|nr:hypothetical protein [bacterium]
MSHDDFYENLRTRLQAWNARHPSKEELKKANRSILQLFFPGTVGLIGPPERSLSRTLWEDIEFPYIVEPLFKEDFSQHSVKILSNGYAMGEWIFKFLDSEHHPFSMDFLSKCAVADLLSVRPPGVLFCLIAVDFEPGKFYPPYIEYLCRFWMAFRCILYLKQKRLQHGIDSLLLELGYGENPKDLEKSYNELQLTIKAIISRFSGKRVDKDTYDPEDTCEFVNDFIARAVDDIKCGSPESVFSGTLKGDFSGQSLLNNYK